MNDPLNKQNIKDRFNGRNDPVAQKILERQKLQEEEDKRERAKVELLLLFYLQEQQASFDDNADNDSD